MAELRDRRQLSAHWRASLAPVLLALVLATGAWACGGDDDGELVVALEAGASDEKERYYLDLLHLVLARTETDYGPCTVVLRGDVLTRQRNVALLSNRYGVELFWGSASRAREQVLRPIRVPLHKGLMSYKVLIIRAQDQPLFSAITHVEQLRALRAGLGEDWPDTEVLRANQLPVVTTTNYETLGRMLVGGRFDYFPRGAQEAGPELRHLSDLPLVLERELLLVYPSPVYFFVNRKNQRLAERLEQGLQAMRADGSFDDYVHNHPLTREALEQINRDKRRRIYLHNPLLPEQTPLDQDDYWLFPWRDTP